MTNNPPILLDAARIAKNASLSPEDITIFTEIDSTNAYLRKHIADFNRPHYCFAESQTHGVGRFNRTWHSPLGENIYFSLLYPFKKKIQELSPLSLIIGISVAETLEKLYQLPTAIQLKWPNDLICDNKKLSGILIEIPKETEQACVAIIGIGINVNMTNNDTQKITQPWTSIQTLTEKNHDRNILCIALIQKLRQAIAQFEQEGFAPFIPAWKNKDALYQKNIQITVGHRQFTGVAMGINEQGYLILRLPDGKQMTLTAGETTLY